MNIGNLSPSITSLIRADHTKVLATFHKYKIDTPPTTKQALVNAVCLSIEIHAQLEEEIFYPAMRAADPGLVEKSIPEHDEMRRLISALRSMLPTDARYDQTFMELMRDVIHHVADEETILLPEAERLLAESLHRLGAQMSRRKLQLSAPHLGEMASNAARAMPATTAIVAAGALIAGAYLVTHAFRGSSQR